MKVTRGFALIVLLAAVFLGLGSQLIPRKSEVASPAVKSVERQKDLASQWGDL